MTLKRVNALPNLDKLALAKASVVGDSWQGWYIKEEYNVYNPKEFPKYKQGLTMEAAGMKPNWKIPKNQNYESDEEVLLERKDEPRQFVVCYSSGTRVEQSHMLHHIREMQPSELFAQAIEASAEEHGLTKNKKSTSKPCPR